ncbi:hypothetical protein BDV93DRAFT_290442 [Ceratobasidium sp. AG-I]|nr:hypothetical protein BDV93DRAFT_290442 [Ceratobasidium sp. AG-I]
MIQDPEVLGSLTLIVYEWENARAHLAKAIRSYARAAMALQAATISHPLWALGYSITILEDELDSLSSGLFELDRARVVLTNTRNAQCSLINRLPAELLASIFQVVVDSAYPHDAYDSASYTNPATKLVRVCSHWRQVALETGPLWSCVVFPYHGSRDHEHISTGARMQLDRSRGSSIDLFICVTQPYNLENTQFRSITNLIKPYMKQLRSLTVRLPRSEDIESLLECCAMNGTTGSLSRLDIFGNFVSLPLFHQANLQRLKQLDDYLRSVRILKLRAVTFNWRCAVFERLDELLFDDIYTPRCPNLTQFAGILSASPDLRRLLLKKFTVHEQMEPMIHPPVKLEHLEKLSLDRLSDSGFCRVASVLSLGRRSPDIAFTADFNSPATLSALRRFASETRVVKLRFAGFPNRQPVPEILELLPHLEYLGLGGLVLERSDLDALVNHNRIPAVSPSPLPVQTNLAGPLPKLKRLALIKCTILCDRVMFKEIFRGLSLGLLNMCDCSIELRTESQGSGHSPHIATNVIAINATTELGIWLTENMGGRVVFE